MAAGAIGLIFRKFRKPLHGLVGLLRDKETTYYVGKMGSTAFSVQHFDYGSFRAKVLRFLEACRVGGEEPRYIFSQSVTIPTLYASAYACITRSLLRDVEPGLGLRWADYFDRFQNPADGLFYDPVIRCNSFHDLDWWGARHLALHMINAYAKIGRRPKHPFRFLEKYYDEETIYRWLDAHDWKSPNIGECDIDNKIMNIGSLLQYQRDTWQDRRAGESVEALQQYLLRKINAGTGMWGGFDEDDPVERSRMVQFAYHLLPLYFYDGIFDFDADKICSIVLRTQNSLGGFGVRLNSSACEDMDSLYVLVKLVPHVHNLRERIEEALGKGFEWLMRNQAADGGFVFRLNEPFVYGCNEMSSLKNRGAMMPTWFRTLCLAYLTNALGIPNEFVMHRCPGYEFP